MTLLKKRFLLLFVPTFFFLILFSGFNFYLQIYYLADPYTWHTFYGKQPTKIEILFSGFRDFKVISYSLILSFLFSFFSQLFLISQLKRTEKKQLLLNGLIITLFLGSLYLISEILQAYVNWGMLQFLWVQIKDSTLILISSYFLIAILLTHLFAKQKIIKV